MKMLNFKAIGSVTLSISVLLLCLYSPPHCHADTNSVIGSSCSQDDNSTSENNFQTNLSNLLNSLSAKAPLHNGFYKSTEGTKSNKIYGLVQCRADVSPADCANCTKTPNRIALRGCSKSKSVKVWLTWCFLHYSDEEIFGVWDRNSGAIANRTDFDDPSVASRGLKMMTELASTAPEKPLMFQTVVLEVGQNGKRYGMAQCTRDLSRSECGKCLNGSLGTFRTTIEGKRGWEIYGTSCSLWYHDFQFYSNISTISSEGFRRLSPSPVVAVSGIILALLKFLLIF